MAQVTELQTTEEGSVQTTSPGFSISGKILAEDGTLLKDYTGEKALTFPALLDLVPYEQLLAYVQTHAGDFLQAVAGIKDLSEV